MLIIGHRGAKGLAPENTKASFKAALDAGVDGIECDVRTSSDGIPVLIHDEAILISGIVQPINQSGFKTLKTAFVDLLTLEEALRFLNKRVPIIIEIKPKTETEPVIECIRKRLHNGWKPADIKISSFDVNILKTIRKDLPEIEVVVNEPWSGVRARLRAKKLNTSYITMNQRWLWGGFIKAVARSGYHLSAYTINDPEKAREYKKAGLYACITDFPDKF
jgi:glycerophosphoryl diester phosphodiesterase